MLPATLQAARLLDADFLHFLASAGWGVNVGLALFFLSPRERSESDVAQRALWLTTAAAFLCAAVVCTARLIAYFEASFRSVHLLDVVAHGAAAAGVVLSLSVVPRVLGWRFRRFWRWGGAGLTAGATAAVIAFPELIAGWWWSVCAGGAGAVLLVAAWKTHRSDAGHGAHAPACAALGVMLLAFGAMFDVRRDLLRPWNGVDPAVASVDRILSWQGAVAALAALVAFVVVWRRYLESCTLPVIRGRRGFLGIRPLWMLPVLEGVILVFGSVWFVFVSHQAEDYAARRMWAEVAALVETTADGESRLAGGVEPGETRRALERLVGRSDRFIAAAAWRERPGAGAELIAAVRRDGSSEPFDAGVLLPTREEYAQAVRTGGLRWTHGDMAFERAIVFAPFGSAESHAWHLALAVDGGDLAELVAMHRLQALAIVGLGAIAVAIAAVTTIRSRNEAEIRFLKESAEAENSGRNAFLGMISHEIRTPLQSVLGYAELAESGGLPEAAARHVRAIRTQGAILLRIVQDILDFSAMRGGALALNPEVVSLRELLDDVQRGMAGRAHAKGIVFSTEFEEGVPPWVTVDRVRLTQVLLNLAINAVKFTDRGGVRLAVGCRGVEDGHARIEILVSDTGPGISPAQLRRLFEPFRKMRDDDTPGGGGVGLGLAISRQIVELLKGTIDVESSDGEGSAFRLRLSLPVASGPVPIVPDARAVAVLPAQVPSLAGLRVLLIDDNPYVRDLLRDFLRKLGADAVARSDGTSGLAACAEQAFDVILLDLRLPDFRGADLAARLREHGRSPTDPWIVGISAGVSDAEIQATLDRGGNDFMLKPVSMAGLAETIRMSPAGARVPADAGSVPPVSGGASHDQRAAFFAELEPMFDRLEQTCIEEQGARLGAEAHYLANGCMVTGFDEGLQACREIEQFAEAGAFSAARQRIVSLRRSFAGGAAARGT